MIGTIEELMKKIKELEEEAKKSKLEPMGTEEDNIMNEKELEYTLSKINEALEGKKYKVTPELLAELKKKSKERRKQK